MKTNFQKIDGRWVVKTGKVVATDFVNYGDDFDVILADQYEDVITGETFAAEYEDGAWHLVKHYDELPEYEHRRHGNQKKAKRFCRVDAMCGVHWTAPFDMAVIGQNRTLRRRMWPNAKQLAKLADMLPF